MYGRVLLSVVGVLLLWSPGANAQVTSNLVDGNYLAVNSTSSLFGGICGAGYCVSTGLGVPFGYFATAAAVATSQSLLQSQIDALASSAANLSLLNARIDNAFAAIAAAQNQIVDLNNRVNVINARLASMNGEISRSLEIGAIAASMRDAIPNPGDRFAIRLNAAGFDGYVGASLGVSVNITDSIRFLQIMGADLRKMS